MNEQEFISPTDGDVYELPKPSIDELLEHLGKKTGITSSLFHSKGSCVDENGVYCSKECSDFNGDGDDPQSDD